MLDVKLLRSDLESVKAALAKRNKDYNLDKFVELDKVRRELIQEVEVLKSKQNAVSKEVPKLKKEGKDVAPIFAEMKTLSDEIKENEYNLNIPRYVDTFEEEAIIDIDVVNAEIAEIKGKIADVEEQMDKYLKELGLK